MPKNEFGNLRTRVVGDIAGIPLVAINTMPMMIDDCPVLINFAQGEEGTSSSELKLGAVEHALRATYEQARCLHRKLRNRSQFLFYVQNTLLLQQMPMSSNSFWRKGLPLLKRRIFQ